MGQVEGGNLRWRIRSRRRSLGPFCARHGPFRRLGFVRWRIFTTYRFRRGNYDIRCRTRPHEVGGVWILLPILFMLVLQEEKKEEA